MSKRREFSICLKIFISTIFLIYSCNWICFCIYNSLSFCLSLSIGCIILCFYRFNWPLCINPTITYIGPSIHFSPESKVRKCFSSYIFVKSLFFDNCYICCSSTCNVLYHYFLPKNIWSIMWYTPSNISYNNSCYSFNFRISSCYMIQYIITFSS